MIEALFVNALALWISLYGIKFMLRQVFPKFNYGMIGKPLKKGFKLLGKLKKLKKLGKLGKPLSKWLWTNQKERRGKSFALFHFSLIASAFSTLVLWVYDGNLWIVALLCLLTAFLYKVHTWIKGATRRPLPGRQRR